MEIIIDKKITKEETKELINVVGQLQKLREDPEMKLKDMFKSTFRFLILSVVFLLAVIVMIVLWGMSTALTIALVLWSVCCLFALMMYVTLNKRVNDYLARDDGLPSKIILDENGISFIKENAQKMELAWSNLLFAREFEHIFMFVSKNNTMLCIVASSRYSEKFKSFIKEQKINTRVI